MSGNVVFKKPKRSTIQNNLETEFSLLGLILTVPELIEDALVYLTEEDFYNFYNREIFRIIRVLKEKYSENISIIDDEEIFKYVSEYGSNYFSIEEGKQNYHPKIFLYEYLNTLLLNAGYPDNIYSYYQELTRLSALRKVEEELWITLEELSKNKHIDTNELLRYFEMKLMEIVNTKSIREYISAKEASDEYYKYLNSTRNLNEEDFAGLPSGFKKLDDITQGFKKGELIIIASRPAMGKTALALNIANNVARKGKNAAFVSLEMSTNQLMLRVYTANTFIEGIKFKKPNILNETEWNVINALKNEIDKMSLFIDDSSSSNISEILWKIKRLHKVKKVDILIIDYLQLIAIKNKFGDNRQVEVSKISRSLKQLARELEIPIIALSQLSRGVEQREDKRPILSDLRESGAIEQDADIVMFLYRENYYNNKKNKNYVSNSQNDIGENTELIIAKHRNGATGKINLRFQLPYSKFSDSFEGVN